MTDMIQIPSHAEIDVRRPDGSIETVIKAGSQLTEHNFAAMKAATKAAGRGELIAYRNITKSVAAPKPSAADIAEMDHIRHQNAVYRAAAGGENCDQIGGANDIDRTPANKEDY
ncbi:MAG: hypothetical protein JSR28_06300 [Proteobacteria bacterium]|nr:hypothetical protein [Pseudomonadota bacterium]